MKISSAIFAGSLVCSFVLPTAFSSCSEDVEESVKIIRYTKKHGDTSGVANGVYFVDMGLPSGTMWAICNYGAASPEDFGDRFAWGEVDPKHSFSWDNYKWSNGKYSAANATLDKRDDAATVNLSRFWRMPTAAEWAELMDSTNCTVSFTSRVIYGQTNGVVDSSNVVEVIKGYKIVTKSTAVAIKGNSLFFRLGPSCRRVDLPAADSAFFWLKDRLPNDPYTQNVEPYLGLPVRPVLNIPSE